MGQLQVSTKNENDFRYMPFHLAVFVSQQSALFQRSVLIFRPMISAPPDNKPYGLPIFRHKQAGRILALETSRWEIGTALARGKRQEARGGVRCLWRIQHTP